MIAILTRNPLTRFIKRLTEGVMTVLSHVLNRGDKGALTIKAVMGALLIGLGLLFAGTLVEYRDSVRALRNQGAAPDLNELPSMVPMVFQGIGVFLAIVAFLVSLWLRKNMEINQRKGLVVLALSLAALSSLSVWLPTDVIDTLSAISGKALAGETPSIPAYFGKLLLISLLILSIPVAALLYFRLSIMDRYVLNGFLTPFMFCLFSFISIWLIADFTDNGPAFTGLSLDHILTFYVVQIPFVILFVMPIAVLFSSLYSLGRLSKSNELISMIGAGRSVTRILLPLFVAGAYTSFIGLAFKYQWAPVSVGYKEAILSSALVESSAKQSGQVIQADIWSRRGWMHVNEPDRRTWFVGQVPLKLSDEMGDVVVIQLDEQDQITMMWVAKRAKWIWNANPARWVLMGVRIYTYDKQHIPTIETRESLELVEWLETPWMVLSSSQNPEFLGIPGLTMYLNANRGLGDRALASFRTNWWHIFVEPLACFTLLLVAAPLGIVYSRRGAMAGVTGAIGIFAFMYIMNATFLAMGQSNRLPPILAASITNIVVGGIGLTLLWFRAHNREVPKMKTLLPALFRFIGKRRATA